MLAVDILKQAQRAGVDVELRRDNLVISYEHCQVDMAALVLQHEAEIVAILAGSAPFTALEMARLKALRARLNAQSLRALASA